MFRNRTERRFQALGGETLRSLQLSRLGLWLLPLGFLVVFLYLPLWQILSLGLSATDGSGPGAGWLPTFDANTLGAIWFTVWQALASTVICIILGVPLANLLYRRRFRGQEFIKSLIALPFVLPSILVAIAFTAFRAWHELYAELGIFDIAAWSHYWIIAAHVFLNLSLVVRGVGSFWQIQGTEQDDAAELDGAGRLRTLTSIWLPQLRGAMLGTGSLVFLFCLASYGIILILGLGEVRSIETEIASAALRNLDLKTAAWLAVAQVLLSGLVFGFGEFLGRGRLALEGAEPPDERAKRVDRRDRPMVVLGAVIVIGLIAIPLLNLLAQSFLFKGQLGVENFENLAGRGERELLNLPVWQAALNSLRNAIVAVGIAGPLGLLTSLLLASSRRKFGLLGGRLASLFILLPLAISPIVLGFGYLISFGEPPFALRQSWLLVPIAQALMIFPLLVRFITPALIAIDHGIRDAAQLDGAGEWKAARWVYLPMVAPVIKVALGYGFVISFGEFGAASLLAYGGQETLPIVMFRLISRPGAENYGMAMAVSALLMVFAFALLRLSAWRQPEARLLRRAAA